MPWNQNWKKEMTFNHCASNMHGNTLVPAMEFCCFTHRPSLMNLKAVGQRSRLFPLWEDILRLNFLPPSRLGLCVSYFPSFPQFFLSREKLTPQKPVNALGFFPFERIFYDWISFLYSFGLDFSILNFLSILSDFPLARETDTQNVYLVEFCND